jgi:DNA-binding response OmpR family regulator
MDDRDMFRTADGTEGSGSFDVARSFEAPLGFDPPERRVLVGMRDHALRRIVSAVLRADGVDAVEAFDETATLHEIRRRLRPDRRFEAVLLDARRDSDSVLATVARIRAADPSLTVMALIVRPDEELVEKATARGAKVLRLPITSRALLSML